MSLRRIASAAIALAAAICVGACSHYSLDATPDANVDLSGRWVLDPAASDDAVRLVAAATPKPVAPTAPRADPYALNDNPRPTAQGPPVVIDDNAPRLKATDRAKFVNSVALPAAELSFEQTADRVVIVEDANHREFSLATQEPFSVTDRYGSRVVHAGWKGRDFVVYAEDPRHVTIEEHFRSGAGADTLEVEVTLKAWNYSKIHVRSRYRRAPEGAAPIGPAAVGPPAKGAR